MTTWYEGRRNPPTRFGPEFCTSCDGFAYVQTEPGTFIVCGDCRGSSVTTTTGTRTPSEVVRRSRDGDAPGLGELGAEKKRTDRMLIEGFRDAP